MPNRHERRKRYAIARRRDRAMAKIGFEGGTEAELLSLAYKGLHWGVLTPRQARMFGCGVASKF